MLLLHTICLLALIGKTICVNKPREIYGNEDTWEAIVTGRREATKMLGYDKVVPDDQELGRKITGNRSSIFKYEGSVDLGRSTEDSQEKTSKKIMKPLIKLELDEGIPLEDKSIEEIENSIIHILNGVDKILESCFSHTNKMDAEKSSPDPNKHKIFEEEFSKLLEIVEEVWVILKTPITSNPGYSFSNDSKIESLYKVGFLLNDTLVRVLLTGEKNKMISDQFLHRRKSFYRGYPWTFEVCKIRSDHICFRSGPDQD
ncbi:hypothetical protein PGTUg99_011053 [Puccinia graminis f. sp. tritici]|uniref:Uncharacterized protein n=1 Tax=Puccinia graminis f. sp. tritici TaxID=56615 RepID=A0A5B0SC57_PUCGR|nr:hypothetical protein PGTUg99_011053 [Puccinia graminis f. sp. tritici]